VSDLCGSDRAVVCSYVFVQRCESSCEDHTVQICGVEPGTQCAPKYVSPYVHASLLCGQVATMTVLLVASAEAARPVVASSTMWRWVCEVWV
jgi:hypothetical protein